MVTNEDGFGMREVGKRYCGKGWGPQASDMFPELGEGSAQSRELYSLVPRRQRCRGPVCGARLGSSPGTLSTHTLTPPTNPSLCPCSGLLPTHHVVTSSLLPLSSSPFRVE